MKKAKRKRPVVARKRKVTARRKPATSRKKRKSKMSKSKSNDDEDEPRTATKHPDTRRTAGDQPQQSDSTGPTSDPVELAKQRSGGIDPMGQPPDNPQAPNPPVEQDPERTDK
jgi:hypothetical protein